MGSKEEAGLARPHAALGARKRGKGGRRRRGRPGVRRLRIDAWLREATGGTGCGRLRVDAGRRASLPRACVVLWCCALVGRTAR